MDKKEKLKVRGKKEKNRKKNYGMFSLIKEGANFRIVEKYPSNPRKYLREINNKEKIISKNTKIATMGSCFAREIVKFLEAEDYNIINNRGIPKNGGIAASSETGNVFTTGCMKQIIDYTFNGNGDPETRGGYREHLNLTEDPYRSHIFYPADEKEREKIFQDHRKENKYVFENMDIFILTLGLSETGKNKIDGMEFGRIPPKEYFDNKKHEFHVKNVEETIEDLKGIRSKIKEVNKNCKIILTVSPVGFKATFRKDIDVVSANTASKAVLRAAVDQFIREYKDILYMPSYEFIRYGQNNPYKKDARHIKIDIVEKTMDLFKQYFVKE